MDEMKYNDSIQYSGLNLDQIYNFCDKVYGDLNLIDKDNKSRRVNVGDYILYDQQSGSYSVIRPEQYDRRYIQPKQYRKKPVVILALKYMGYDEETFHIYQEFCPTLQIDQEGVTWVSTLEGKMIVTPTDYIIQGVQGQFYACKQSVFEKTYTREY